MKRLCCAIIGLALATNLPAADEARRPAPKADKAAKKQPRPNAHARRRLKRNKPAVKSTGRAPQATPANKISLPKGFRAELLYSVPSTQGSWVSMTVDPKGRLICSDQYGGLYRIMPAPIDSDRATRVEKLKVESGMAHGLLYAFDSLYAMVNSNKKGQSGLYRLQDTDGDDQFDKVTQLKSMDARGEHGPHAIVLSPDKKSIYVCAGNHTTLPEVQQSRAPR